MSPESHQKVRRITRDAAARDLGGVNHCSLHCRLAKIRGLMYGVKYIAVIGRDTRFFRFFVCAQYEYAGYGLFLTNHSVVFDFVHQSTDFRQTTV